VGEDLGDGSFGEGVADVIVEDVFGGEGDGLSSGRLSIVRFRSSSSTCRARMNSHC
jgi:hypothetical protein